MSSSTPTSSDRQAGGFERAWREMMADYRQDRTARRLAEVPVRYRGAQATEPTAKAWLSGYERGERRNLVLVGSNGRGKTTNAYALYAELLRKGVSCRFLTAIAALRTLKTAYDEGESEEGAVARLTGYPVLFLDDLGKENPTEWAAQVVMDVLDTRAAEERPVVATTNLAPQELVRRYGAAGPAIVSRLFGGASVAKMYGPDMRMGAGR